MRQRKDSRGRYRSRGITPHVAPVRTATLLDFASPQQEEAFRAGPFPLCLSGGFGAGKTRAFFQKILYLSAIYPGYRTVILRSVWDKLRLTTMQSFFKMCPPQAYLWGKRADTEKILEFNPVQCDDGVQRQSSILWMHLENVDEKVIRGLEVNAALFDQAEEIAEDAFDMLDSRLGRWDGAHVPRSVIESEEAAGRPWPWWNTPDGRPAPGAKPIPPSYSMLTCNPDTYLHWIYRRFHPESPDHKLKHILDEDTGELKSYFDLGYRLIQMDSLDNKYLSKQQRQKLLNKGASFIRRYVKGEWGIPEGQIHHVTPLSELPGDLAFVNQLRRTCALHRTLDYGDVSPTACLWWAVDREGRVFCFQEYYEPRKRIREHRSGIAALSIIPGTNPPLLEVYESERADPSIFAKEAQVKGGRYSLADEYKDTEPPYGERDAIFWRPADNNELGTRDRIDDYLRLDENVKHPLTGLAPAPRLYFIKRSVEWPHGCEQVLTEIKSQRRVKVGEVNGVLQFSDERDEEVTDHAYDCVRYFIASRAPAAVEAPAKPTSGSYNAVRLAYKASRLAEGSVKIPGERVRSRWRR